MTKHYAPTAGIRDIARRWPLIMVVTLIAVAASLWSVSHRTTSYTATTRLVVVPVAQWDETFLGTSLIRDAGDANRTAATVAALLNSPRAAAAAADHVGKGWTAETIQSAVTVSVVKDTNTVDVVARSDDPEKAVNLADGYAQAALADRWRAIAAELDTRIAAITATTASDPNAGEASARLQTLTVVRQLGSDPTLRIDSTSAAVRDRAVAAWTVVSLAAAGGLFVGLLAAAGMARVRGREDVSDGSPAPRSERAPAYSSNGRC